MNYSQLLYKASATLGLGLLSSVAAWSQVNVTATGGTLTATYPTVAAAVAAINAGTHTGTIAVNVNAGHTETAPVGGIALTATGTLANPITIQKSGAGVNPVITAYVGGTGTPGSATQDGIFRLVGSDFVTIDGIDLAENAANTANPATMEYGYALYKASATDGCQNNTIRNCTVTLSRTNNAGGTTPMFDGSIGILMINSTPTAATTALAISAATGASSNNRFYTNTIQNANIGIALSGFAAASPFTLADMSNDIGGASAATGNIIRDFGGGGTTAAAGIRINSQWSCNIAFNTINNNTGAGVNHTGTLRGILTGTAASANLTISNNSVSVQSGGTTSQLDGISSGIGSTAASNLVQISNNIVTLNYSTATGAVVNGIVNAGSAATVTMSSNTVTAPSLAGTGTHLMLVSGSPTNLLMNNNVVTNVVRASATTGTLRAIVVQSPTTATVNGNTIDGLSYSNTASTGSIDGIYSFSSVVDVTINNNIIRNLSTPTTGTITGIREFGSAGIKTIQNNIISNFGTTAGGAGGAGFSGVFVSTGTVTVSSNQIFALNSTGTTGGTAGSITGVQMSGGASILVASNKIYNLSTASTGGVVSGVLVSGSTANTIQNNMIGDLRAPAANLANAVIGINITGSTTSNVYYNTVYLAATSTGTNFGTSAISAITSNNLTLNNNIFVNASTSNGTGSTVAYRRSSATLTSYQASSNRNDFFAPVIYTDGTTPQTTLAGYQTAMATRDANSISENPTFLSLVSGNANYLKINTATATAIESGGAVISGINDDLEGDVRFGSAGYAGSGFAPDMGADEFNGTSTVVACSGTPAAANAIASVTTACASTVINLSLSTTYTGPGFTYQWQSSTDGSSYSNISGATLSTASVSQTTATFYRAIVACTNSAQSITATPVSVTQNGRFQCYCAPTYATGPGTGDGITRVALNTLSNTSGNAASPYYTFFNTVTIPTLTQSATETISVTFGSDGSQFAGVWIDYNQDGDFADAGEFVTFNTVTAGASGTAVLTFTVPAGALTGQTMMRVRGGDDTQLGNTPCGASASSFGETEDYIVNIVASTACSGTPTAANAVSSVTSTCPSAVINLSLSTTYTLTGITYQWQSSTDGSSYTNIAGATSAAITATQTTATFYRAIVTCANSAQSITATPVSVSMGNRFQCYCAPTYTNGPGLGDSITRVAINTLNNPSGASASPYYTFFNTVTIPTLTQNATETVSVTFGAHTTQHGAVWIDYNQDGDFADAGEFVANTTVSAGSNGTAVLTFTVPAGALTGQTMMRVRGGDDSQLGNTPCGASASSYGETEDYIVNIVAQPACTGTPAAANAVSSVTAACPSTVINLSLSTTYTASGITYQWQSSTNGGASYTNISGATAAAITATQTTTTFYRAIVTCANSGQTISTAAISVTQNSSFQCYCAATYTSGPGTTDGITNVTLGTLNNTSTQNNVSPYYTFFGTVTVPNLGQNSNQTISVTFGSDANQYGGVWIDYNQDGDFADAGEFVAFNTTNAGASGTAVLTFTVPAGATLGQTLMRVRGGNDSQLTNTPCGASSSGFGETEDYIVNIVCVSPTIASTVTAPSCAGGNNGMIATTATGGVAPYMYMWSNGQTTAMATGLMAGTYTLTVAETGGCRTTSTFTVTNPSAVSVTAVVTSNYNGAQIACFGGNNGEATATMVGGVAPYMYMWSNNQTANTATGLAAGSYIVTATDANGCAAVSVVTLTQPSQVSASISSQTNVNCFGDATGSATAMAAGGTGSYTYMWVNGSINATATGLAAGVYNITTTDVNNCASSTTATITQPTAVTATAMAMAASCANTTDGAVMVSAAGGTGALSYNIGAGAQASGSFTGLAAGSYTVTVTDANGCMTMATASVAAPAAISATTSSTAVSCNGGNNGTATVSAVGGVGAISFNWITGATTATITNLFATTYAVTATDANGCEVVTNIAVTQPAALVGSAAVSSNYNGAQISCFGAADGAIVATAIGGTAPYMFMWPTSTGSQTTATVTGLAAGSYRVTITDANGCTNTVNTAIGEPSPLDIRISTVDASCNGDMNGIATASVTGGTVSTGYTFMWSNNQTANTATGLAAGSYTVMVTDLNGCMESATAVIAEPAALSLNLNSSNVTACGGNDGMATATVGGGTTPYMYMWSNGATTDNLMMLSLGIYSVTVTDANGCMKDGAVTINEPSSVSVSATSTDALCNAAASGTATAVATGGLAPYVFNWSDGTQAANAPALAAGVYIVTATDAAGCSGVTSVTISEPAAISVSTVSTDEQCSGCADGTATATAAGGTGALMFMWSNGQTTATITGLSTATYTVTVTDANGCEMVSSVLVDLANSVTNTASADAVKLYPNPTAAVINVENIPANARIQLVNALGQVVRSFEPNQTTIQMDMSALAPATYYVQIISQGRTQVLPVVKVRQ